MSVLVGALGSLPALAAAEARAAVTRAVTPC
jgi:hypothetical protein